MADLNTQRDRELAQKVLSSPLDFPHIFKVWLTSWLESNPPRFLASQLQGYYPLVPTSAFAGGDVTSTSSTYESLSGGPEITELEAGQYLVLFGATMTIYSASDKHAFAQPRFNGASLSNDDNAAQYEQETSTSSGSGTSVMRAIVASVDLTDNTVELQYRRDGGTAHFKNRWLITLRTGNV